MINLTNEYKKSNVLLVSERVTTNNKLNINRAKAVDKIALL